MAEKVSASKAIGIQEAVRMLPSDMQTSGRYALVIGVSDYQDNRIADLPACVNDARSVYEILTKPSIGMFNPKDVILLLNESVTRRKVINALEVIANNAGKDDLVLVYFSGHGAVDKRDSSYWVMYDTDISGLRATALPESDISGLLADIRTTRLVMLIDSCYSAATAKIDGTKAVLDLKKLYPKFSGKGRVAITASDGDQRSVVIEDRDNPGYGYSAFSWHLIEALKGSGDLDLDGVVTVDELWGYVKDRTTTTARKMGGRQEPQLVGKIGSKFLLTLNSDQLIENIEKSKHSTMLLRTRLDKIEQYYINGNITLEQYNLGKKLFNSNKSRMDSNSIRLLEAFTSLSDGDYSLDQFKRTIESIGLSSTMAYDTNPDGLWSPRSGAQVRLLINEKSFVLYSPTGTNTKNCSIKGNQLSIDGNKSTFFLQGDMLTIVPSAGVPTVYQRLDYQAYQSGIDKAGTFRLSKSWDSGLSVINEALKINPYSLEALKLKSEIIAGRKQEKIDTLWSQIRGFKSNENFSLAIAAIDDLLKLAPDDRAAQSYRSELETLKEKAETIARLLSLARREQHAGKFKYSIATLDKLLELDSAHAEANQLRIEVYSKFSEQERKKLEKVRQLLSTARANDSKENGKIALTALDELLQLEPTNLEAQHLQNKIAGYFFTPTKIGDTITNSLGMKLTYIPSGTFQMGSPSSESNHDSDEGPVHTVHISKPFMMGVTEVTQKQYESVMGDNPSHFKGSENPVEQVTWNDAVEFCRKLSQREDKSYRLPTEAEWEYACRAGTTTIFSFGDLDDDLHKYGNYCDQSNTDNLPWKDKKHDDGYDKTANVGSFSPNVWGLYDIHGNVWEWCSDWYADKYPSSRVTNPTGPSSGKYRVLRGGSWYGNPGYCRSADRGWYAPGNRSISGLGFRIILDLN